MQAHFAAAAERHPLWRGHYRLWSVLDRQVDVLELLHSHVQFVPLLLLGANQNQHQVGANGKIHRLVGDNHGVKFRFQPLQALVQHGDQVGADGVHLGMKFAAHHAVAKINQARPRIALNLAASILQ